MTPNDILLYSYISDIVSHSQESFFLLQMRTHRDCSPTLGVGCREIGKYSSNWTPPVRAQGVTEKRGL